MNPLTKFAISAAVFGLLMGGSYVAGVYTTTQHDKAIIADMKTAQAMELDQAEKAARAKEQASIKSMADIDQQHQKASNDEIVSRDNTIADLRSGALQLRKHFTCGATTGSLPAVGTSSGVGDAGAQGGLQRADEEFLVRLASEANQVTVQLQQCQAVTRADRAKTTKDQ